MAQTNSSILPLVAITAAFFFSGAAFAREPSARADRTVVYIDEAGDVREDHTLSPAKIHIQGTVALTSTDYFRGRFDGVKEDPADRGVQPSLRLIFELAEDITFTAGVANGLTDRESSAENLDSWYQADSHFGFAGKISHMFGGLTYIVYGSPNGTSSCTEEITLDMRSTDTILGPLTHWLKLAWRTAGGSGFYFEAGIDPEFSFTAEAGSPVRVSFPLSIGTGWNRYYTGKDWEGYISTGLRAEIPVIGNRWTLVPAVIITFRDEGLAENKADDAGGTILGVSAALSFLY